MIRKKIISIVVPAFNEAVSFNHFYVRLSAALRDIKQYDFEIIVVDDGSVNSSVRVVVSQLAQDDPRLRLVVLSRNFGKEAATTAGIHVARGAAIITIDADGQHPVQYISKFIDSWEAGNKVVIGLRTENQNEGFIKRIGSKLFYKTFNSMSSIKIKPQSTDFRLIDKAVQEDFIRMREHNRITRVLIDWLGYGHAYIEFKANSREFGKATYGTKKLVKLALDSTVSHSSTPLFYASYLGMIIFPLSVVLALIMVIDSVVGDPLNWHATGSAYIVVLMLGLIGILLISQGIIGLYLSQIQIETKNRPLYIIDEGRSVNL